MNANNINMKPSIITNNPKPPAFGFKINDYAVVELGSSEQYTVDAFLRLHPNGVIVVLKMESDNGN